MKRRRQIIVYIATSADGYIARKDGGVEWLDRPRPKGNYGMGTFFRPLDTILWGRKTYEMGLEMAGENLGIGPGNENYVFSRRPPKSRARGPAAVGERVPDLRQAAALPVGQGHLDDGRRQNHRLLPGRRRDRSIRHPRHSDLHRRRNPSGRATSPQRAVEAPIGARLSGRRRSAQLRRPRQEEG